MATLREVSESPLTQGGDEQIAYSFDFTAQGTPSAPAVTLYDLTSAADVTATLLSGAASVNGNVVTAPTVKGLTAGRTYKLTCLATVDGNKISYFCIIKGE